MKDLLTRLKVWRRWSKNIKGYSFYEKFLVLIGRKHSVTLELDFTMYRVRDAFKGLANTSATATEAVSRLCKTYLDACLEEFNNKED